MKTFKINYIFILLFSVFFLTVNLLTAQSVNKNAVPNNKIRTKTFGNNEISYLSSKDMVNGTNLAILPSGIEVEVVIVNEQVSSIKLNDYIYKINNGNGDLSFGCFGNYCACYGEEDCKDMFGSGKCQDCFKCSVCIDDYCVCNANVKKVAPKPKVDVKSNTNTSGTKKK